MSVEFSWLFLPNHHPFDVFNCSTCRLLQLTTILQRPLEDQRYLRRAIDSYRHKVVQSSTLIHNTHVVDSLLSIQNGNEGKLIEVLLEWVGLISMIKLKWTFVVVSVPIHLVVDCSGLNIANSYYYCYYFKYIYLLLLLFFLIFHNPFSIVHAKRSIFDVQF